MKVPPPPFTEKERIEPIVKIIKETPVVVPIEKKKVCLTVKFVMSCMLFIINMNQQKILYSNA